jgi:predicted nucleic acid-binding protein
MAVLVSDTSVLIDLERGQLLERVFSIGLTFVVPDFLYQNELADTNGPYLRKLGLGVLSLSGTEMALVQTIRSTRNGLSLPDCSALVCALRGDHVLLAGDGELRDEAKKQGVDVRGLFWILDQLEASGQMETSDLHAALCQISSHKRCRLPKQEITERLHRWDPGGND